MLLTLLVGLILRQQLEAAFDQRTKLSHFDH
jgi:hypothetical protein